MQHAIIQELTNSALLTKTITFSKRKAVRDAGFATYKKEKMHKKSWSGNTKLRGKNVKQVGWKRLHLAEYAVNGVHIG